MNLTDHELMSRCATGDMQALEALVRRWDARVTRVLRRLVGHQADVEDLRQEAFVRVLAGSGRYRATAQFSTWLYRIVVNLARDSARRRRPSESLDNHQPHDRNGSPATEAERKELVQAVEAALQQIPSKFREILVLRHYGELTFAEIAGVLSQPESTTKSRAKAGLQRLHSELVRRGITNAELEP